MVKIGKKYFIFNTIFIILQITLLICALIMTLSQGRNMRESILVYVILEQLCFAECCGIILGGLSYIKKWKDVILWPELVGIVVSFFLMVYSCFMELLVWTEGVPLSKALYVEIPSVGLLIVKTIVDGVLAKRNSTYMP
ncbi:MAG: hypothetical protein J6D02_13435 [Lachnospira sp.]|nr:hypothetical protein [Lachnospira sp.]